MSCRSKEEWLDIFERQIDSGLSISAFCRVNGYTQSSFRSALSRYHVNANEQKDWESIKKKYIASKQSVREFCLANNIGYKKFSKVLGGHNDRKEYDWEKLIHEYIKSGLSIEEFCTKNNISSVSFQDILDTRYSFHRRDTGAVNKWTRVMEEFKKLDMDQKSFCELKGICYNTFVIMRHRLKKRAYVFNIIREHNIRNYETAIDDIIRFSNGGFCAPYCECRYDIANRYIVPWLLEYGYVYSKETL